MTTTPELLTLRQAAQQTGLAPVTLRYAISRGRLPAYRQTTPRGDVWLVESADLEHYLATYSGRPARKAGDPAPGRPIIKATL